jgi:hypothetical protein
MVKARKEQFSVLSAYWTKIIYTATGDTSSTVLSAATLNVSSITQTSGGNASSNPPIRGVVTAGTFNNVCIRNSVTALPFSVSGAIVYGRITFSSGNYTITYYSRVNGIETATNIPGSGSLSVEMLFPEVMNYSEVPANALIINEGGFVGGGGVASSANPNLPDGYTSAIQLHDKTHSPVGLWQFNKNTLDSSGNGLHLTIDGAFIYDPLAPGLYGISHTSAFARLYRTQFDAALAITGDMTIEFFVTLYSAMVTSNVYSNASIVSYGLDSSTAVNNYLYKIDFSTLANFNKGLRWIQESGVGVEDIFVPSAVHIIYPHIVHVAVTRTSNVIQFYLNGLPAGAPSSTLTTPTGGSNGKFHVLTISDGSSGSGTRGVTIASLKVIASALTADEIKAEYNRTFGPAFGTIS